MGITRLAGKTWLAVPMMAATIGLATPAAANAATAPGSRTDERPAATLRVETTTAPYTGDARGLGRDRWKTL